MSKQIAAGGRSRVLSMVLASFVSLSVLTTIRFAQAEDETLTANQSVKTLNDLLEPIQKKFNVPALAGALIQGDRITHLGAVGVRKLGSDVKVTANDQFHLGSCTKAMTATLVGILVDQKKLTWNTTIAEGLPTFKNIHPDFQKVTLQQLLTNRGGAPSSSAPKGKTLIDVHQFPGDATKQRLKFCELILEQPPEVKPGTKYLYSNAGFAIAGTIAEQTMGESWERLMTRLIFNKLQMQSAGFGAMGVAGKIEQPYQHAAKLLRYEPIEPKGMCDNPVSIAPAGLVHCNLTDWSKFVAAHMSGYRGKSGLVSKSIFKKLHTSPEDSNYAMGWAIRKRNWAGGTVLTHSGSNTMNFAVVWIAPKKNMAFLACCNAGGSNSSVACDQAVSKMIQTYLN